MRRIRLAGQLAEPVGHYTDAVEASGFLYISGMLPVNSDGELVGTGDVHYLRREDYDHHTALLCVQTKSTIAQPKMTFETNEFYLRDSGEMIAAFAEWPEAIASTLEIA